jgi:2-keto-4-pentenoate hydratase/2-oxohepta-3-ene-1,7-dioic acid hydratase in catechol pathway
MTLQAGDVILTGTAAGVSDVNAGDEVACEIDGITARGTSTLLKTAATFHFGIRP